MKELHDAYNLLWDNIAVMQIPHHGSEKNFNEDLIIHHGAHIISNRNQPNTEKQVSDTFVINMILSKGEFVAKNSGQHINIPNDYYWRYRWDEADCWHCPNCPCC